MRAPREREREREGEKRKIVDTNIEINGDNSTSERDVDHRQRVNVALNK